jgi:hypothetical protein
MATYNSVANVNELGNASSNADNNYNFGHLKHITNSYVPAIKL